MPEGGTLTIRTYCKGDNACISVSDTGMGISEENLTRVFDPFFTTKGLKGWGLGLSAVRAIVTAHEGHVTVDSVEGEGSTFTMSLPILTDEVRDDEVAEAPRQDRLARGAQYRILAVDGERLVRYAMENILEQQGHQVVTAEDGVVALKAFGDEDFDLVLLDLGLPQMNGYRVAEEMKKLKPQIQIILATGWRDDVDRDRMASIGIGRVVAKPFQSGELLRTIEEVMEVSQRSTNQRGEMEVP